MQRAACWPHLVPSFRHREFIVMLLLTCLYKRVLCSWLHCCIFTGRKQFCVFHDHISCHPTCIMCSTLRMCKERKGGLCGIDLFRIFLLSSYRVLCLCIGGCLLWWGPNAVSLKLEWPIVCVCSVCSASQHCPLLGERVRPCSVAELFLDVSHEQGRFV